MKFGSCVPGVEPPVDGGSGGVALLDQSIDFPPEGLLAGEPLLQAGRDRTLNSISAMFNQLPCLGV